MNQVWVQLVRGSGRAGPDRRRQQLLARLPGKPAGDPAHHDSEMASIGFQSLKYMTADVVLDGGFGGGAPTNSMYFLNTDYMYLRPHKDRFFAPIGDERFATNQDAMVKLIGFAGNMTISNRRLQGVLSA
jgi:hypothetical protein